VGFWRKAMLAVMVFLGVVLGALLLLQLLLPTNAYSLALLAFAVAIYALALMLVLGDG